MPGLDLDFDRSNKEALVLRYFIFSSGGEWVYACEFRCPRSPAIWGPLGAGVKVVVSRLVWVLVTKLGFSGQTESAFNY